MRTEATIARGEMRFASGRPVAMIADSRPRYSPVGCPLRLSSALAKSRSSNVIESLLSQARGAAPRGRGEFAAARPRWNSQARALPPRSAGRGGSRGSGLASAGAAPSRTRESFRQVFREASWTASSASCRSRRHPCARAVRSAAGPGCRAQIGNPHAAVDRAQLVVGRRGDGAARRVDLKPKFANNPVGRPAEGDDGESPAHGARLGTGISGALLSSRTH